MADQLPRNPSHCKNPGGTGGMLVEEELQLLTNKWYFTKEEIENCSPSRKDGICHEQESHLRKLYCSFIQELGVELKVPQVTIATAMILCHRFYMRQSHAKNHWQTIAAVSMFLACKAEETPRWLSDFVIVAYKLMYKWDPSAPQRIRQREVYHQQKELFLLGERLLLATVAFDLNIEQPYKPLVVALKKFQIPHKELVKVAWNFVNDMLHTTLCLQYKPPYIAAGSACLAAKLLKVKLPKLNGNPWWMQFDVSPRRLEEVIQQMLGLLEKTQKQTVPSMSGRMTEMKSRNGQTMANSPESCISSLNGTAQDSSNITLVVHERLTRIAKSECIQKLSSSDAHGGINEAENYQPSDHGSANSIVEDGDGDPTVAECGLNPSCKTATIEGSYSKIDVKRIREMIKRRRMDGVTKKGSAEDMEDEIDSETWIQRELENGIRPRSASPKKQRVQ